MLNIQEAIATLTLAEKASLCSGRDFWTLKPIEMLDIPPLMMTDGPHGLRKQAGASDHVGLNESVPATCFPTASALASTWDRDLIYRVGEALGEECLAEQVGVILGPGANIKRSPLCGRNFEYFSEDPYLSGEMAKAHINGVQSKGVGTSIKHYVANNQETRRMSIDTIVDERALREIYMAGFEIAVKEAQPWTVMSAYNRIHGEYCSEHHRVLTQILKDEWGHKGIVVTDWGAINDRVAGLIGGTELQMPGVGTVTDEQIVAAVESGALREEVLDAAVARLLTMMSKMHDAVIENPDATYDKDAHHALARQVAGDGAVLLKNDDAILPLDPAEAVAGKVTIIGAFAKVPRYQGSGSSQMNPTKLDNAYDEIMALTGASDIPYSQGYDPKKDDIDESMIAHACEVAQDAEVVLLFAGLTDMYESEAFDRVHMQMPASHDALIEAVAKVNPNVVVILSNGSPVEMPWVHDVKAILEGYLGGQAGAGAIADILYGEVTPSGKLAETFPLALADNASYKYFPGGPKTVEYRESIYVGYRYYDTANKTVLFPFGHGLSYTKFSYSDLQISSETIYDSEVLTVSVTITNVGDAYGKEVVQLYVRDVESTIFRPEKELKGFAKVSLHPWESRTVEMQLDKRAFAYYNIDINDWQVESGEFELLVGSSSADIKMSTTVTVTATQDVSIERDEQLAAYYTIAQQSSGFEMDQATFEALCGRTMPPNEYGPDDVFDINTPISDMKHTVAGRLLLVLMRRQAQAMLKDMDMDDDSPFVRMMEEIISDSPLRLMVMMSGGQITYETVDSILLMANGKWGRGVPALVKSIFGRKK
ncbi:MAG: glycoside hydrolase family 3 C-terminal domain-containing protein [Chloroflexota bacterium]